MLKERLKALLKKDRFESYSQEGEDRVLLARMQDHSPGIYVDLGAHHPHRFSNTKLLYDMGWRGANVEPHPNLSLLFQLFRPQDLNLNCGCAPEPGLLDYHQFEEAALNTFSATRITELSRLGYSPKGKLSISVMNPNQILQMVQLKFPDWRLRLLTIDTEGLDLPILQAIDWTTYQPDYLICESHTASLEEHLRSKIHHLLSQLFNLFASTGRSVLYELKSQ